MNSMGYSIDLNESVYNIFHDHRSFFRRRKIDDGVNAHAKSVTQLRKEAKRRIPVAHCLIYNASFLTHLLSKVLEGQVPFRE